QVHEWRRSYRTPPPAIDRSDDRHPSHDARYAMLPPDVIPSTECLADVVGRMLPYWHDALVPDLRRRQSVLVAAHGNSLRALVMHLDGIDERDIADLNIPTGIPLSYQLDDNLNVIERMYLGDPEVAKAAAAAVAGQAGRQEPQPRGTKS
ncbi:MAG: 2,3-bisphosphoglycerate-dependent phosphoglycerate mutase, partial [Acidimicrobiia bacterium]|nr:2,3-bisphosphoglycerate-dependent phosphoglycerate mutase [Acidimicrobiia bacterium]